MECLLKLKCTFKKHSDIEREKTNIFLFFSQFREGNEMPFAILSNRQHQFKRKDHSLKDTAFIVNIMQALKNERYRNKLCVKVFHYYLDFLLL